MIDFSAYMPKDRLYAVARNETLPTHTSGAALFADVSGFTPLTSAFAKTLGKKRGAEALLSILNPLYEALIEPVHRYGGSVIGFAGDAITCWFEFEGQPDLDNPVKQASLRAVAAALAMQQRMAQFDVISMPTGVDISLSVKAGIAAGSARRFLVGDAAIQRLDTLAGELLVRMALAEKQAKQGEVIVSREVAESLSDVLDISDWRGGGQYAVVDALLVTTEPTLWPSLPKEALPAESMRPWIHPVVYEQLHSGTGSLGDLRPITPLMLSFGGIDFDTDEAAGEKLDAFITWVQRTVHYHGGVLLELVIGDKGAFIYCPFGAPLAHENDPARAMRAALALRDLPPDLADFITPLKIGLARGEVWTGNCGGHGRYTYGVMGSDVSLAARLMSHAQPGQILVSGRMSQYPGFRLQHIGDLTVKGFDQPVPTYGLLGEMLAEEQIFSTPMVGRTAELQQLLDFAQPLSKDKLAGTAIIYGEAGIGKSRLAYALRQRLAQASPAAEISWFTGQTDQILRQAFNPFVYWLQGYFGQLPEDTEAQNKARFDRRFEKTLTKLHSLSPPPQSLIAELTRTQSFLGALLGLQWDDSLYQQLNDPRLRYQNMITAVRTLLLAESRLHPVVFELEDGQWLDEASRDLLLALSRNVAAYPLLIVITSRYYDDGAKPAFALDEEMPTLTLDLAALSREAVEAQTLAILGGSASPALLTLLWERSHANPFFVEQMLLHFQEMGALVHTAVGDWELQTIPSDLPVDVNAMLIARIDRLTQQVKEIVQVAAVLGREFDVRLLSHMLRANVLPEVQRAENEQIWSLLSELRYIFKHALLRDAAYEMQLSARLQELHLLAATTAEQVYAEQLPNFYDTLAYHYHSAYQLGAKTALEKTCAYLHKAGEAAQKHYNNMAALAYYAKLLPLLTDEKEQ
ncbi:MAG: AAA family ATPase, partial [Anaerolineales bacterium]|nr:AAA family ATPase [Anaerolineales bacterium]